MGGFSTKYLIDPDSMYKRISPKKRIDKEQFEKLCSMGCRKDEVCYFFDVSGNTLLEWCKENYEGKTFEQSRQMFEINLKIAIRQAQIKHMAKSADMAKYLGKIYLGQDEKQNITIENKNSNPLQDLSEEELKALINKAEDD